MAASAGKSIWKRSIGTRINSAGAWLERSFNNPPYLSGGRSNYIEDDDTPLIGQMFPQAEIATLPEAGHWVHVDDRKSFSKRL